MKRLIQLILICCSTWFAATSCEEMMGNYLDKPPGVDVTEDTIFSTQINAETFLMGIYLDGMYTDLPMWNARDGNRDASFSCYCDEAENVASWYASQPHNAGNMTPSNTRDGGRWTYRWRAIRSVNIFLDRIDGVPDATEEYKRQARGQALFIRGLCYFEMFKRYAGVPIVDKRFDITDPASLQLPRASVEELVNFIAADADEAASLLPDSWRSEYVGKATKGAALMLKSRTLLYAASPLFNTATPPIALPENNQMICYGNTDANRWQLAADAAKAVIDWAPAAGVRIIDEHGPDKSYRYVWETPDNEEIILTSKLTGNLAYYTETFKSLNGLYYKQSGTQPTQNFVQKYEKKDGTPQVWDPIGGNNLAQLYAELDPRFEQSIGYNGSYWNPDFPEMKMWEGEGGVAADVPPRRDLITGYWIRKWVPAALTNLNSVYAPWTLYRLAEAYLNYAEALNESQGPVAEAYAAVNKIRTRSGMPDFPPGLTKEQFREKIRNERSIELAFEEHRLWDVARWVIAGQDGIMRGRMYGIKIFKIPSPSTEFRYEQFVFEDRTWKDAMYHFPFPTAEVNKGYAIQNPGY